MSILLAGCAQFEAEPAVQVASTGSSGSYLVVLDNCPALREVTLSVLPVEGDDGAAGLLPLWQISRQSPPANVAHFEVPLGGEPNGWAAEVPFGATLSDSLAYRIDISPGNRNLEFTLSDVEGLDRGQAFTDRGVAPLSRADATQPCDSEAAWGNLWRQAAVFFIAGLLVLLLLGTTLVKILQVVFANRTGGYDDEIYDSYPDDWDHDTQ